MVFRMNLTYNEIDNTLSKKCVGAELKSFSFPNGRYEVRELNITLNSFYQKTKKRYHSK